MFLAARCTALVLVGLATLLPLAGSAHAQGASITAFPGTFVPSTASMDGLLVLGNGTPAGQPAAPAYRWASGQWQPLPSAISRAALTGADYLSGNSVVRLTSQGAASVQTLVGGAAVSISPDGQTVTGIDEYGFGSACSHPTIPINGGCGLVWSGGSYPTRLTVPSDGDCAIQRNVEDPPFATGSGIFALTAHHGCGSGIPGVRYRYTGWPGGIVGDFTPSLVTPDGRLHFTYGSLAGAPPQFFYYIGQGAYTPPPAGCALSRFSYDGSVAGGSACVWRSDWDWTTLLDLLDDQGVDVDGWSHVVVNGFSGDGRVAVGTARLDGATVGFRAVLGRKPMRVVVRHEPEAVDIGQPFTTTVEVTNLQDVTITNVAPEILVPPPGGPTATVESGPTPASVASLAPGATAMFTVAMEAAGERGNAEVLAVVTATGAGGASLRARGRRFVGVTETALAVSLDAEEPVAEGDVFTLTLEVANATDGPLEDVGPEALDLRLDDGAAATVLSAPPAGTRVALPVGGSTTFEYELQATSRGAVEAVVRVVGREAGGDPVQSEEASAAFRIRPPAELTAELFAVAVEPSDGQSTPGRFRIGLQDPYVVTLSVENTGTETITGITPPAALPMSGDGQTTLTGGPTPPDAATLAPGEFAYFDYAFTPTGGGEVEHLVTVSGLDEGGDPLTSTEARLNVDIEDLVVTVEIVNADGAVTEAPAGRNRRRGLLGNWIVDHVLTRPGEGTLCVSGCVDIVVRVEDANGDPVENADVTLFQDRFTSAFNVTPEQGGGFVCTPDIVDRCGASVDLDATDADGESRGRYWFPGLTGPASAELVVIADHADYYRTTERASVAMVPTRVEFATGAVEINAATADALETAEQVRAGTNVALLLTSGCKKIVGLVDGGGRVPLDNEFVRAKSYAADFVCGKMLNAAEENARTIPEGGAPGLVGDVLTVLEAGGKLAGFYELDWFHNAFQVPGVGLAVLAVSSPAPPFLDMQSDWATAVQDALTQIYQANGFREGRHVQQIELEVFEVSYRRIAAGGVSAEEPALYLRVTSSAGEFTSLVRVGYAPGLWLTESSVQTAAVTSATAGGTGMSVAPPAPLGRVDGARQSLTGEPFAPGHVVVLSPGTASEERVQVATVAPGSVTLTTPLRFSHAAGALVRRADSLAVAPPPAPVTADAAGGRPGASVRPTLAWTSRAPATRFTVHVATDSLFVDRVWTATGVEADSVVVGTPLAEGVRHYWRVRGHNLLGAGPWSPAYPFVPVRPASDDLAAAVALPDSAGFEIGRWLDGATTELDEAASSCGPAVPSVWFTWTAAETGRVVARTDGSTADAAVSVWTGAAHPLVEVACGAPVLDPVTGLRADGAAEFIAEAGTPYRIRVAAAGEGFGLLVVEPATPAANTFTVTTTADSGPGSLRQALTDFRLTNQPGRIAFAIPGAGPHVIRPASALPIPTFPLVIDGFTQPGSRPNTAAPWQPTNAVHMVVLDGSLAGTSGIGLTLRGSGSVVRGLQIVRFGTHGILLNGGQDMVVEGCTIGTDAAGAAGLGNGYSGVWVDRSTRARIGGATPAARNVISGNGNYGVLVYLQEASGTVIEGNFIGTTPAGTAARANGFGGIYSGNPTGMTPSPTSSTAVDVRVGGTAAGAGNLISGNTGFGVLLNGQAANVPTVTLGTTRVEGNRIGTNAAGTAAVPNTQAGVAVRRNATGVTIGGSEPGAGNLLSGNLDGVYLEVSTGIVVEGNRVGTDASGTAPLGNSRIGIFLACADLAVVRGNVVGGSPAGGVGMSCPFAAYPGAGNRVEANWIGTDPTGTADLGNGSGGIVVGQRHGTETIGGADATLGNVIAFNDGPGVFVRTSVVGPVAVRHNTVCGNAGAGLDLEPLGATPNDPGDADTGPNNLQNAPVVASATGDGAATLTVTYSVDTAPASAAYPLTVDLYLADAGDTEPRTWIGQHTYATPQASATTSFTPAAPVAHGASVVAVATDAAGRSSEASAAVAVAGSAGGATTLLVDGGPGWRMLSLPLAGSTVATLAAQNLVQGLPDYYPGGAPNLFTGYDGTAWVAPAGGADALVPGRGFIWYLHDVDFDPGDGSSASRALPMTLTIAGPPPPAETVVPLHVVGNGWNLVGNPFPQALDLGALSAWAEGGSLRSGVAQTWDPAAGATGSYVSSSLTGDALPAWSGAFVQNRDAARLRIPASAVVARRDSTAAPRLLAFEVGGTLPDSTAAAVLDRALVAVFRDDADDAWDAWDAAKLAPLSDAYVLGAWGSADDEVPRAQASFPRDPTGPVLLPLHVEAAGTDASLTISWPRLHVPDAWRLSLLDLATGETVDLRTASSYAFDVEPAAGARSGRGARLGAARVDRRGQLSTGRLPADLSWRLPSADGVTGHARFVVRIEPDGVVGTEGDPPAVFALAPVAPNPTRGDAVVRIEVPRPGPVRVAVYDALGREVGVLADGEQPAGRHALTLAPLRLAAGVYAVRMTADAFAATRRLTVVR